MQGWLRRFRLLVVLGLAWIATGPALAQGNAEFEARAARMGALQMSAQYLAAEREARSLLAWADTNLGKDSAEHAHAASRLAGVLVALAQYDEAGMLYADALAVYEKRFPGNHPQVATGRNNLGNFRLAIGDLAGAEGLLRSALEIRQAQTPPDPLDVSGTLTNLALVLQGLGRGAEGEALLRQALDVRRAHFASRDDPLVAAALANLALALHTRRQYEPARELLEEAVAMRKRTQPSDHPEIAGALTNLGLNAFLRGLPPQAETLFAEALAIRRKSQPPHHPEIANNLLNLAIAQRAQKRLKEAHRTLQQAVTLQADALTRNHPSLIAAQHEFALIALEAGHAKEGLQAIAEAYRQSVSRGEVPPAIAGRFILLHEVAAQARLVPERLPFSEALEVAQRIAENDVAKVVSRMAARQATRDPRLAEIARQRELHLNQRDAAEKRLGAALALAEDEARTYAAAARKDLADIDGALRRIEDALAASFPGYFELVKFKPLSAGELSRLITDDEALLQVSVVGEDVFVFGQSREKRAWMRAGVSRQDLARDVQALRQTLDADREIPFDTARAHKLYQALLAPLRDVLGTKRKLVVVPTGPLSSIPLEVLLTAPVPVPKAKTDYREMPWLVKQKAILVVPSIGSLQALRQLSPAAIADAAPFLGVANPVYRAPGSTTPAAAPGATRGTRRSALANYWRGGGADVGRIFADVEELPETENEVRTVGAEIGKGHEVLKLREDASVSSLRALPLDRFKVIYFATHGLVAVEVAGLAEPALVLSRPPQPKADDVGLLTATDVSQLKLMADWVVLSACNTAAGDQPGADGLRGLARAFFQSGARALLVSHWRIDSEATVDLMTRLFKGYAGDNGRGKAEAARQAALGFLKATKPELSHPTYWAAFSVVGDG